MRLELILGNPARNSAAARPPNFFRHLDAAIGVRIEIPAALPPLRLKRLRGGLVDEILFGSQKCGQHLFGVRVPAGAVERDRKVISDFPVPRIALMGALEKGERPALVVQLPFGPGQRVENVR